MQSSHPGGKKSLDDCPVQMTGSEFSSSEDVGVKTRCSPHKIAEVVAKFGTLKRKLVTDIGFKGMLEVPDISNLDKKFTLSLLEKFDIKKRAIRFNDEAFVEITAKDVHHFLDIPNGPKKLFGLEDKSTSEQLDFIRLGIGSISGDVGEKNSLKAAEDILLADYPTGMSAQQEDQFKVSFVCFCMGNFLVAKYSSNHGAKDYWGSLMEVPEISSYDFCEPVVEEIIEAAKHVQKERKGNRTIKNVSGCHLFLQAKFLHTINLGILNLKEDYSPMIAQFTFRVINEMKIYVKQNTMTIKTKQGKNLCVQRTDARELLEAVTPNIGKCKGATVDSSNYMRTRWSPSSSHSQTRNYGGPGFMSQKKTRERVNICDCVNTIQKPKSTEYLSAYARGIGEKRLNHKQVDVLQLHNARTRLLVNRFKSSTLKDMDCDPTAILTCKEVFNSNVNKLLKDLLDQVHVLSVGLHDNSTMYNSTSLMASGSKAIHNQSDEHLCSEFEGAPTRIKRGRYCGRIVNDITGRNLIHDLTGLQDVEMNEADNKHNETEGFVTPKRVIGQHSGSAFSMAMAGAAFSRVQPMTDLQNAQSANEGFVTPARVIGEHSDSAFIMDVARTGFSMVQPVNNFANLQSGNEGFVTPAAGIFRENINVSHMDITGSEFGMMEPQNRFLNVQSTYGESSGGLDTEMFNTPGILNPLRADSPRNGGHNTSGDSFDEILGNLSDLELHQRAVGEWNAGSTIKKIRLTKGRMARSPWSYAVDREVVPREVAERVYNWLGVASQHCLKSCWVKHGFPTYKQISGDDFKGVFRGGINCTEDIMDMAIRRFGQNDKDQYGEGRMLRWMHPFESDFAATVLNTEDYLANRSIEVQLTGKCHEYDVSNCRMVSVPHLDMDTWTAYFWDMKSSVVHVVDPTFHVAKASELQRKHGAIVDRLQSGLESCFNAAYIGWDIDWANWRRNYVLPFLPGKSSNDSGMLTLLALREYNGEGFAVPATEASLRAFSMNLLYNMLGVEGNKGLLPDVFVQTID